LTAVDGLLRPPMPAGEPDRHFMFVDEAAEPDLHPRSGQTDHRPLLMCEHVLDGVPFDLGPVRPRRVLSGGFLRWYCERGQEPLVGREYSPYRPHIAACVCLGGQGGQFRREGQRPSPSRCGSGRDDDRCRHGPCSRRRAPPGRCAASRRRPASLSSGHPGPSASLAGLSAHQRMRHSLMSLFSAGGFWRSPSSLEVRG
jgi:hypothetical protein